MSATTEQLTRVRALVGDFTLSDGKVRAAIERYPVLDLNGQPIGESDWIPTYDLHAATADLLEEKAAEVAREFDFATESQRFDRSQKYNQLLSLVRWHRSRRIPQTISLAVSPKPVSPIPIGNAPEPED
jgi:hypothetical protein